ncbi:hypothetical protein ACFCW6_33145 [Streptomyces sp. NPDC056333]|uniref:hypothetical protein n=1 Tax=Streptomyces sp. NPDC056333 TaxID=3345786 RepID=UPI0035E35776
MGDIDEIHFPTKDFRGVTPRLCDPSSGQWNLHWADTTTGALLPPVTGGFTDGRGDFHAKDTHEGRPVRVHFVWSDITADSARWNQRFSADDRASWETNSTLDLTRTGRQLLSVPVRRPGSHSRMPRPTARNRTVRRAAVRR